MTDRLREEPVISVIDDDESMRDATVRLVRSFGYAALAFASAHAFLHSRQTGKTACLISDIHMPQMSGMQLLDALRARGCNLPIIFITAFNNERLRAEAMNRGAVCFLSKPFRADALSRCLAKALKK
jgi:FixJ family two-component response regulator